MKSRYSAYPYVIWMVIFTVVPLLLVAAFAITDSSGAYTLENISAVGVHGFDALHLAGSHCHGALPGDRLSVSLRSVAENREPAAHHADAGDAAHLDELFASHLRLDDLAGKTASSTGCWALSALGLWDDQHRAPWCWAWCTTTAL